MSVRGNRLSLINSAEAIIEVNYLENLKDLDISYQSSFRPRERKHVPLRDESVTYKQNPCADSYFIKFPTGLEILRARNVYYTRSCLPPVHTSNHSHLKYLYLSDSGFLEWIGPLGFNSSYSLHIVCLSVDCVQKTMVNHLSLVHVSSAKKGIHAYRRMQ